MDELGGPSWLLGCLLDAHTGLLDHAEQVRAAAIGALMDVAQHNPAPFLVSPFGMLEYFIFAFTKASGVTPQVFRFLVGPDSPEARASVERILDVSVNAGNDHFGEFVKAVPESKDPGLAGHLRHLKLSSAKSKILKHVLEESQGKEPS